LRVVMLLGCGSGQVRVQAVPRRTWVEMVGWRGGGPGACGWDGVAAGDPMVLENVGRGAVAGVSVRGDGGCWLGWWFRRVVARAVGSGEVGQILQVAGRAVRWGGRANSPRCCRGGCVP